MSEINNTRTNNTRTNNTRNNNNNLRINNNNNKRTNNNNKNNNSLNISLSNNESKKINNISLFNESKTETQKLKNNASNTVSKIKNTVSKTANTVSKTIEDATDKISNTVDNIENKVTETTGTPLAFTILKVVFYILLFIVLLYVLRYLFGYGDSGYYSSPFLLEGSKNARHALNLSQDPESTNYVPILRSDNQDGIEFSYQFWFLIEDFSYNSGKWKHMFHKGNASSYPNRAPGVWIHPNTNSIRVYMNTQEKILEYVDVKNIPLRKWVHMAIVLRNKELDIYVNGYLKSKKVLDSLPRQNDGDFWINMYGGFDGYMSKIRYFNHAVDFTTIDNNIRDGPSSANCIDTNELPPYLDDNWWYS